MEKRELAQLLNDRFGLSIDWTKLRKEDIEQIDRKFQSLVPKEDISAENISIFVDDPLDFALEILQKYGGQLLATKVEDIVGLIREEGIGKGEILKKLGLGEGGIKRIIKEYTKKCQKGR